VVAIEMLSAAAGLHWRLKEEPSTRLGAGTRAALEAIEARIGGEVLSDDIERLAAAIRDREVLDAVTAAVGALEGVDRA
jgi:histidine ammonia-lyase